MIPHKFCLRILVLHNKIKGNYLGIEKEDQVKAFRKASSYHMFWLMIVNPRKLKRRNLKIIKSLKAVSLIEIIVTALAMVGRYQGLEVMTLMDKKKRKVRQEKLLIALFFNAEILILL